MNPEELLPRIARIDERTKLILQRLDKINGKIEDHEKRIESLEKEQEKHKSYFKMIGAVLGSALTAIVGVIFGK